jgi:hypothetical protein
MVETKGLDPSSKEMLAAVGPMTFTPAGRASFSNRLLDAFAYCKYAPVTVRWLDEYLRRTKKIDRSSPSTVDIDTRYYPLQGNRPIILAPFAHGKATTERDHHDPKLPPSTEGHDTLDETSNSDNDASRPLTPLHTENTAPTSVSGVQDMPPLPGNYQYYVVFKVLLNEDIPVVSDWENMLSTHAPPGLLDVTEIRAERIQFPGAWKSSSTLLIVSVPLRVWDFLSRNPIYTFIGLTKSLNLVQHQSPPEDQAISAASRPNVASSVSYSSANPKDTASAWIAELSDIYERWRPGRVSRYIDVAASRLHIQRIGKNPAFMLLKEAYERTSHQFDSTKDKFGESQADIDHRIDEVIARLQELKLQSAENQLFERVYLELNILRTQIQELKGADVEKILCNDIAGAIKQEKEAKLNHGLAKDSLHKVDSLKNMLPRRLSPKTSEKPSKPRRV